MILALWFLFSSLDALFREFDKALHNFDRVVVTTLSLVAVGMLLVPVHPLHQDGSLQVAFSMILEPEGTFSRPRLNAPGFVCSCQVVERVQCVWMIFAINLSFSFESL